MLPSIFATVINHSMSHFLSDMLLDLGMRFSFFFFLSQFFFFNASNRLAKAHLLLQHSIQQAD